MDSYQKLIEKLISDGYLRTPLVIKAFKKVKRADFLPESIKDQAYLNEALPIGHKQTISQPLTVAFMLELLAPQPGQKILDVGSGSGWQAALLAEIVGPEGKVIATEIVPELKKMGEENVRRQGYYHVAFFDSQGEVGSAHYAPYDRIIVAAAAREVPRELKKQLKVGGRLVLPVGGKLLQDIRVIDKVDGNLFQEYKYPGFRFVPLIRK